MTTETKEKFLKEFHFATKDDETMGIETATYANGNEVKRVTIPDGRVVMIHELSALELSKIDNMMTTETQQDYIFTQMHFACKIDGKQLPIEDWKAIKGKAFNRIKLPLYQLNF